MKKDNRTSLVKSDKKQNKAVYAFCLVPLVSTAIFLFLMSIGQVGDENHPFAIGSILGLLGIVFLWGFIGSLFAKAKVLLLKSTLIANCIPLATTVVYAVLYAIAQVNESADLLAASELIGGLGTGLFGILGSFLHELIPLSLFEVFIDFGFMLIVFIIGYTLGSGRKKKKAK